MASQDEQRHPNFHLTRRGRLMLTCVSIALNAATAGGIFTFPLLSSALSSQFHLTQPQLTTIVLAGVAGHYPLASLVGSVVDNFGPWTCSLASAVLFSAGFGLFSLEIRNTTSIPNFSASSFLRLVFFYFLAGIGTMTSVFSALFCASKNFPKHSGVASGSTMAIHGLSPTILSLFASSFFTDSEQNFDMAGFTAFLAILTGIVNAIGAITLKVEPQDSEFYPPKVSSRTNTPEDPEAASETEPLLMRTTPLRTYDRVWDVLKDHNFWLLTIFASFTLSTCEMVISNIGTISLALPGQPVISTASSGTSLATTQVRLLSLSNTISRIMTGAGADFVSPVASYLPSGVLALPRRHKISRVAFLWGSSVLIGFAFLWMNLIVGTQSQVWVFSIAIGLAYGAIFAVIPSVVSSIWGLQNLARNYGLLIYAPFVGTPLFSYLYAFISGAVNEGDGGVCEGKRCWNITFYICASAAFVASGLSALLWRDWRGKI